MKIKNSLTNNIAETLYVPLLMKSRQTNAKNAFFKDIKACEIRDKVDYDFSKFGKFTLSTTVDLPNRTFKNFRAAVDKPRLAIEKDLVLLLEDENIAIDVKFISWGENQVGEFSYERSSK
jgi:hypothetical protein